MPELSSPPSAWLQQPSVCGADSFDHPTRCVMSRPFERALRAALPPSPDIILRIVSYNLLANKYALTQIHDYCPLEFRRWSYRFPRLCEEILGFQGDIVCLQEVEDRVFDEDLGRQMRKEGFEVRIRGCTAALYPVPENTNDLNISACAQGWHHPRSSQIQGPKEGPALFVRTTAFEIHAHRVGW